MTRARDNSINPFNNNYAGKNFVINGGFDVWQRGTSFVNPFNIYTTDRWTNDTTNMTLSQQSSGAPSGSRYYLRTTSTAGSAFTDFYHFFETSSISALWGKTATYSFKIRKSGTTPIGSFIFTLQKSSTVDAGRNSTWSTIATVSTAFSNISTGTGSGDWTTVTATANIPNDGTASSLRFIGGFDNAQSSGIIVDISQVQLEIGSFVTPFCRAGGTIDGEIVACQRYFYNVNYQDSTRGIYNTVGNGFAQNTTNAYVVVKFPVAMRVGPTLNPFVGPFALDDGALAYSVSNISLNQSGSSSCLVNCTTTGMTAYRPVIIYANGSSSARLSFSAEL